MEKPRIGKFLNVSALRKYCADHGRRLGRDFIIQMDRCIESRMEYAVRTPNSGKKTLDASIAEWVGFKKL